MIYQKARKIIVNMSHNGGGHLPTPTSPNAVFTASDDANEYRASIATNTDAHFADNSRSGIYVLELSTQEVSLDATKCSLDCDEASHTR